MKTVEEDTEGGGAGEEGLDEGEIENAFEKLDVVLDGVNDFDLCGAIGELSDLGQVDLDGRKLISVVPFHSRSIYSQAYPRLLCIL